MHFTLIAGAVLASLLLGACASKSPPPQALVEARSALRSAELNPAVLKHAPMELKKASDSLTRANQMQEAGDAADVIGSAAYVAAQQTKVALAVAQAKENEGSIAGAELERERARADSRTAEARRAQAKASQAQAQVAGAQQQTAVAEQRAAVAQANASDAQAQAAQLQQELSELKAEKTERGTLVTLGDVLFESGRADLKPGAQASMRKLADFLQKHPTRRVLIEGHTDSVGTVASNNSLSRRRADAVDSALEAMGVARGRVTTVGYGEEFPVATNTSDTNRALNRRVEVYIADNDQAVRQRR